VTRAAAPDLEAVRRAASRIAGRAHRTPVATCSALDDVAGRRVWLKCESFQKAGAFKFRGACNAVMALTDEQAARGVATHSSGNHAQALALAARLRGIPAHIVMPRDAPAVKRAAVEGYGGRIVECEPGVAAREEAARRVVEETGAVFVHPYEHPDVIAGQGTAVLELLEEVGPLDAVVAPVGGGGLLAGTAIAGQGVQPGLRVLAAEPAGADDAARSLAAGRIVPQTDPRTVADGLRTSLGALPWTVIQKRVERVVTVSEEAIAQALRLIWERAKLVIEPSAAVAVAALTAPGFPPPDELPRVGVLLSGGNLDLSAAGTLLPLAGGRA